MLRRTFRAAPGQENLHFRVGVLRSTFEDTLGWADLVEGAHGSSNPAWGPDPAWELTSSLRQEQPGAARCSQEQLGPARSSQEQAGAARGSQEQPGAARSSQGQAGVARGSQELLGAARGSQRSSQEQPGAAQESPGPFGVPNV